MRCVRDLLVDGKRLLPEYPQFPVTFTKRVTIREQAGLVGPVVISGGSKLTKLAGWLLILSMSFLAVGCGGGGGGGGQEPSEGLDPQCGDVLKAAGLAVIYESSKDTYAKSETVHFWLSLRNDSSRAHTVEVHSTGLDPVGHPCETYSFSAFGYMGYPVWSNSHSDTPSWQIQPGQTVKLFDVEWSQKTSSGGSVEPGVYEMGTEIWRVWLDGKQTSPLPLAVSGRIAIE